MSVTGNQKVAATAKQTPTTTSQTTIGEQVGKQTATKEISQKKLVLMWAMILIGYFLFVVQWYSIGNFAGGYNSNIGTVNGNPALASMPNWTITLMRGIGSILAGYLLAKIGHKYAVVTVLSLMVLSFPFLIVIGMKWDPNTPEGYNSTAFGLFLFFRLFLAIGGTTLITYTNSVIAKMPTEKRPTFMTINQFGFNGGAFFANFFFCFGLSSVINADPAVWLTILTLLLAFIAIILVVYIMFGMEVLPPQKKQNTKFQNDDITFGKVFKQGYTWKMSTIFIIWLIAVVFINSATMRTVIEQSPANLQTLIEWNIANKGVADTSTWTPSIANTTLGTASSVVVGSGYNWVWPTFICMFVAGFFVGLLFISPFSKTIYKRKLFFHTMFILGFVFAAISLMIGYFGGYGNDAALAFFFIFIFISGMFLWAVQPVLLSLYQQAPQSNPKYAGIIAGLIWGIGYVGYTIFELIFSLISSYAGNASAFAEALGQAKSAASTLQNGGVADWVAANYTAPVGNIVTIIFFFIACLLVFIPIQMLPPAGIKDANGNFVPFTKTWKPWEWNFKKPEVRF
ncbi:MAG: MFS transporter [Malacoplasma sp.]|nr:MFS transporter [Malacoplasma sp.]MDE7112327.1 MFS transporter [Malacoplasma sp.]